MRSFRSLPLAALAACLAWAQSGAAAENPATGSVRQVACQRLTARPTPRLPSTASTKRPTLWPRRIGPRPTNRPFGSRASLPNPSGSAASASSRSNPIASTATSPGRVLFFRRHPRLPAPCPTAGKIRPSSSRGGRSVGFASPSNPPTRRRITSASANWWSRRSEAGVRGPECGRRRATRAIAPRQSPQLRPARASRTGSRSSPVWRRFPAPASIPRCS